MAINQLFLATAVGTGTGGSTQTVTVNYSGVTGNNCMGVLLCSARTSGTTYATSATLGGNGMTQAVEASGALGGFGEGTATIFYLALGNLVSASGSATFTLTGTDGQAGRIATLVIYDNVQQVSPVRGTDTNVFTSSGSNSSVTMTAQVSDLAVDCLTLSFDDAAMTPAVGQAELANIANGSFNGDTIRHGVSSEVAPSGPWSMTWASFLSAYAHAGATLIEDAAPTAAVITEVNAASGTNGAVRPAETNAGVTGTDFNLAGTTTLILSPTTNPDDGDAEAQPISAVTATTLNWDSVVLGAMETGDLNLFVRTDTGGGGEQTSAAFPVIVSDPDIRWQRAAHVTNGATGLQAVVTGLPFKPVAVAMQVTGNSAVDTLQGGVELGQCLVDRSGAMGIGVAAQASPLVTKRKQINGAGALFIMDPTSDVAPDFVVGSPVLTDDGLEIDFSVNMSGRLISMTFLGGKTARADLHEIRIDDLAKAGIPWSPDVLIGISSNQTQGTVQDTDFARQSFGMANGSAQFNQSTDMDTPNVRNTSIAGAQFLAQLSGTAFTWDMVVTALTSDGYTWAANGTGLADSAYVLALGLDTAQSFLTTFASGVAGDGASEALPDSGLTDPGVLFMTTSGKQTTGPSVALGGRWSSGVCFPDLSQGGATILYLPETGVGVTEQIISQTNILQSSSVSGTLTLESRITAWSSAPTIQYIDNPQAGIWYNMFMAESIVAAPPAVRRGFAQIW
jgi:hypothetical protein